MIATPTTSTTETLPPFFEDVQSHYDSSNEFFFLFLDPWRVYSCAYFERDSMSLAEAQLAKIDLSLGKLNLKPGMRLLDIGCGWGGCCRRAAEKFGARALGLTLSRNQLAYITDALPHLTPQVVGNTSAGTVEVRLQAWEEFQEPVDRIVSIGAFEHFRRERYPAFFSRCRSLLPTDGRMLLHSIVWSSDAELAERNLPIEHEHVLFGKFIRKEIFPGGELCRADEIVQHSTSAGFRVTQIQSLREHYVKTLTIWAANLERQKPQAIALMDETVYERYMKYMLGCAKYFDLGYLDVKQFTLEIPAD